MDRTDLDIPEGTVWPESDAAPQTPVASKERLAEEAAADGPAAGAQDRADSSGEQSPSLDLDDDSAGRGPKL